MSDGGHRATRRNPPASGDSAAWTGSSAPPDADLGTPPVDRCRAIATAAGILVTAIGAAVLVGWATGQVVLTELLPGLASMKANTAASLALLGTALVLVASGRRGRAIAGRIVAALAVLVAGATILEYVADLDFGIDEAVFRDAASRSLPGRPSLATAAALVIAGAGIVTLDARRLPRAISHILALIALTITAVTLIGYLYGVEELYSFGPFSSVALHTAASIAVLSFGILVAQPASGPIGRAAASTPGGYLTRSLLPATLVLPVALGYLVLLGARQGLYSIQLSVALLVVAIVILLRLVVYRTAAVVDAKEAERRHASEEARRADERQRIVARTIADGIVTIDDQSRIAFVNPAAERMFGYSAEELVGRTLTDVMPERFRSRHLAAFGRYVEAGAKTIPWDGVELVGLRRDGEEFPIDVAFAEDRQGDHRTFTGAIRDISTRKRLETQLVQAQRLESVGLLAGGIAHDFNNILTAILGFTRLALDEPPEDDPERRNLREIEAAAQRASDLVAQLLAFSRQQVFRTEVLDVGDVVGGLGSMLERLIGEDVAISLEIAHDLWPIEADRGQLEQVIVNLVVNARDAMPGGGRITIEASNVELDAAYAQSHAEVTPGPQVLVAVSDTGIGMDPVTQGRIFEPFFTTKEAGRGTGLGLATVYGIVGQSRGHVWVYSEAGIGTTFRLYFPRAGRPYDPPADAPTRRHVSTGSETVLVAEDEDIIRDLVEIVLRKRGYRVLLAMDARSAIEIAGREPIDLLLTDVVMPGGSGIDLATALRATVPGVRVLFMSGYTPAALELHGRAIDGADLLQKPFTPDGLAEAVRRALDDE